MLRRDVEYVLTWNAAAHTWDATPIRRDRRRIVRLDPDGERVGVPDVIRARPDET